MIDDPEISDFGREIELSGAVQKGPFLIGTSVTINELNIDLIPTGLNYSSQIENNAGLFQLPSIEYSSQYLELKVDGFFYNEVTNTASVSPITLYAISDISDRSTINVNMLSTLERPRIKQLIGDGIPYQLAKRTAYNELMVIFGMPEDTVGYSEDLNIALEGEQNAKLLALSVMLLSNNSEAELSELVSNISFDIREDGILNSINSTRSIYSSIDHLNTAEIRQNLTNRFDDLGISAIIPLFEDFLPDTIGVESIITDEDFTSNTLGSIDVTVSGGTPPYSYMWSNGSDTEDLLNIPSGEHLLSISDSKSYSRTFSFQVGGVLRDHDNNIYKATRIGDQIWMGENLKVTHYRNGDPISTGHSDGAWVTLSTGAYAAYGDDDTLIDTYGLLYNWFAVNDSRNIAPAGWHIPTDEDWQTLVDFLGGKDVAGNKLKDVGAQYWGFSNSSATNESGFTALPGGYRINSQGFYDGIGTIGSFWSSTEHTAEYAGYRELNSPYSGMYAFTDDKKNGFSIRCLKD